MGRLPRQTLPPDALLRKALDFHRQGRWGAVCKTLDLVPEASRTAGLKRLLAISSANTGHLDKAIALLRDIAPDGEPEDIGLLAELLFDRGDTNEAHELVETLLQDHPDHPRGRRTLARILLERGQSRLATAEMWRYLALAPDDLDTLKTFADGLIDSDPAAVVDWVTALLARSPADASVTALLARAEEKAGHYRQAAGHWGAAADLAPDNARYWHGAVHAWIDVGDKEEAYRTATRGLEHLPDDQTLMSLRCLTAVTCRHYDVAETLMKEMTARGTVSGLDWNNLAAAFEESGLQEEAVRCYRKCLKILPGYREANSNLLFSLNYVQAVDSRTLRREHELWAKRFAPRRDRPPHRNRPDPDKRLRIGYVSRDFNGHVVSYFLRPLIENHDPQAVETYAYVNLPEARYDAFTEMYRKVFHRWRPCTALGRDELAERIETDGIDILVDLAGHTGGNRLEVFGHRPAPVQVTWLGYPNTTGLEAIDYRVTDGVADPRGLTDDAHTETLWRLPDCFLAYQPNGNMPNCDTPPFERTGVITFGCFNKLNKVTEEMMHGWARILSRVEGSRLVLKAGGLTGEMARNWVMRIMAEHGVASDRLDLRGQAKDYMDHAKAFQDLDIALDPFPYNGTTSTCEALWASVPVITRAGDRHASRVSASILNVIGLRELAASGQQAYEDIAVGLAQDPERLRTLHQTLRQRMQESPLLDGPRFARAMETAYREMWQRWCATRKNTVS
jgi:predicted O-linked N-acetylglucosamine transferase (SPINDLY family)